MNYGIWKIHHAVTAAQIDAIPGCTPLLSAILQKRGLAEEPTRSEFLYGGVELLHDPFLLDDMDKAVARMRLAAERKEKIAVYGDYDVDGITSSCMVADWLGSNGFDCTVYIPDRVSEGYGLNRDALTRLHSRGVRLIITVDCGVTAVEEAAYARSLGMDLIITDHHECGAGALPEAAAVIDPKRPGSRYPNRDLAGIGVAFKLLSALEGEPEPVLLRWSDLIALGTVADVMPLTGENRMLVSAGMCKLRFDPLPGLAALIARAGAAGRRINSSIFGYTLAPRLNAAGRLCRTDLAVELLLTEDGDRADELAQELCELNRSRQQMEQTIWTQSRELLAEAGVPDGPIVLAGEQWHQGVIGIAASRLAEDYLRPAIMITFDGGEIGKGSCRSFGGFNLYEALAACSEYLVNFGGHALAAGLNIRRGQLEVFRRAGVTNAVCVVTRYFGGVLLGTGGLLRAYTAAAADALASAGISEVRRWLACEVSTPYALYEPVRAAVAALGGVVQETQYAAAVTVCALLPEEAGEAFAAQVRDLTAGRCAVRPVGETERAVPLAGSGL